MTRGAARRLVPLLVLAGCGTTTPLAREVDVGRDAYAVLVGDGRGTGSDLYAVSGRGGRAIQLTYSPVDETAPALAPDGGALAFVRRVPSGARSVWVLNLLSGAEREIPLPDSAGAAAQVGWSGDGRSIYVRTESGTTWQAAAPPSVSRPARAAGPAADSALMILVGSPAFGRVAACPERPDALCVLTADGVSPLPPGASAAAAWGGDSLAYISGGELFVRPLGPGRVRPVDTDGLPASPRLLTAFGGLR